MPEDPEVAVVVEAYQQKITKDLAIPIGETGVELDCRFEIIRTEETRIANFIADCIRQGRCASDKTITPISGVIFPSAPCIWPRSAPECRSGCAVVVSSHQPLSCPSISPDTRAAAAAVVMKMLYEALQKLRGMKIGEARCNHQLLKCTGVLMVPPRFPLYFYRLLTFPFISALTFPFISTSWLSPYFFHLLTFPLFLPSRCRCQAGTGRGAAKLWDDPCRQDHSNRHPHPAGPDHTAPTARPDGGRQHYRGAAAGSA